jgi:hypothetical protein
MTDVLVRRHSGKDSDTQGEGHMTMKADIKSRNVRTGQYSIGSQEKSRISPLSRERSTALSKT